jgi:hypothetical protein
MTSVPLESWYPELLKEVLNASSVSTFDPEVAVSSPQTTIFLLTGGIGLNRRALSR